MMIVKLLFVALVFSNIQARKLFNGRPNEGFVPRTSQEARHKALNSASVKSYNFTQVLDHFDPKETRTWQQVYWVNDEFYEPNVGRPMFVYISGEAPGDVGWMTSGQWYKNAKYFGASLYQLEHRFYGNSHPTEDASTENLKYLSSEQALADLDVFIHAMMTSNNVSKVVVFGGSYAGNLAAWYRAKYPTALGSIASSAPVTATVDFYQYMETVGVSMEHFRKGCYNITQDAFAALQSAITDNMTLVDQLFKPCTPGLNTSDPFDINTFFMYLIDPWQGAVQYSAPDVNSSNVAMMCEVMSNEALGTPLERLSHLYKDYNFNYTHYECAPHDYRATIVDMKKTSWDAPLVQAGTRQWIWQTCSEFAYYQTTDSPNQPFGQTVSLDYLEDTSCLEVFGQSSPEIKAAVVMTNLNYGATDGDETNVFLPNGSLDPWHNLAIYQKAPHLSDTIAYIQGTSHCYDMFDDRPTDPPQLTEVRNNITLQIARWLTK